MHLDLSNLNLNRLVLPENVEPRKITHLYLENNLIQELPEDFFAKLYNLEWVDLRNNLLTGLPEKLPSQSPRPQIDITIENSSTNVTPVNPEPEEGEVPIKTEDKDSTNSSIDGPEVQSQQPPPPITVTVAESEPIVATEDCKSIDIDTKPEVKKTNIVIDKPRLPPSLKLHTILLQNNLLEEYPNVLSKIPTLKVVQVYGNPMLNHANEKQKNVESENEDEVATEPQEQLCNKIVKGKKISSGNKTKLVRDIVPSEERVRKVTAARRSSRRQQLEQIGVDRVLQRAKDAEARKNFRRRFYERTTTSEARTSSSTCPIGIDRDKRVAQRDRIQFDAIDKTPAANAIDQLCAEVERVLGRHKDNHFDSNNEEQILEEVKNSQAELRRVLGELRKAGLQNCLAGL